MTKYTQKFKLDIIQEYLDTGCSQRWLENKYSLPKDTLEKWWTVYNLKGPEGLKLRHFKRKFTVDFKLRVINYYLNNDVSMSKVAASHNLLCSQISIWLKLFMEGGSEALKPKKKGRPSKMSKMTKKNARKILKKESDEIAALKSELRQVKMERDILKKSLTLFGPSKPRRENNNCGSDQGGSTKLAQKGKIWIGELLKTIDLKRPTYYDDANVSSIKMISMLMLRW